MTPRWQLRYAIGVYLDSLEKRVEDAVRLAKEPAAVPSNAQLREWAQRSGNQPPASWWNATDDPFEAAQESPPAVEIAMRMERTARHEWRWEVCLDEHWPLAILDECGVFYGTAEQARKHGNKWLIGVSKRLGVNLVPKWESS